MLNLNTFFLSLLSISPFCVSVYVCVCVCVCVCVILIITSFALDNLNTQEQEKEELMRALPLRSGKSLLPKT